MTLISNFRHLNPNPSEPVCSTRPEGIQEIFDQIRALPASDGPNQLLLDVVDAIRRHFNDAAQVTYVDAATQTSGTASAHLHVLDTLRMRVTVHSTRAEFSLSGSSMQADCPITHLSADLGADHLDQLPPVLEHFRYFLAR